MLGPWREKGTGKKEGRKRGRGTVTPLGLIQREIEASGAAAGLPRGGSV